jgi:hypothetical protein
MSSERPDMTMSDTTEHKKPARFPLTPRQLRLRYLTYILLAIIAAMIAFGMLHPAFRMTPPAALTDRFHTVPTPQLTAVRKAFALKLLFIGIYWATCVVLTLLLPIFAWLYTREIQLQELMARRDFWREVSGREPDSDSPADQRPSDKRGEK